MPPAFASTLTSPRRRCPRSWRQRAPKQQKHAISTISFSEESLLFDGCADEGPVRTSTALIRIRRPYARSLPQLPGDLLSSSRRPRHSASTARSGLAPPQTPDLSGLGPLTPSPQIIL